MLRCTWFRPFRQRFQDLLQPRCAKPGACRPHGRLRLEILEDRTVLSPTLVADINQQPLDANVSSLVNLNGELYFSANDSIHGNQLWKTDGTANGTVMVTDINPAPQGGLDPNNLTAVGNNLFFGGTDGTNGVELWKSDGTANGTTMVADLNPGAGSSNPGWITNLNGTCYFAANNGQTSLLYKSDGTASGTVAITGNYPNQIGNVTPAGNSLYFFTNNPGSGDFFNNILWTTDGTTAQQLTTAEQPNNLTPVNNDLFYSTYAGAAGFTLYRANATQIDSLGNYQAVAGTDFEGDYYFSDNITHALYRSDGIAADTVQIATFSNAPSNFVTIGNTLYFTVQDNTGVSVWKSDGTTAGTVAFTNAAVGGPSNPSQFIALGSELYFLDTTFDHGYSLWKSDGTAGGTVRLADVLPAGYDINSSVSPLTGAGNKVFMVVDTATTDFRTVTDDRQLWVSDGTAAGTKVIGGISQGSLSSSPTDLVNFNGSLAFVDSDGVHGSQLYVSNGTAAGTVALTSVTSFADAPHDLVSFDGKLYFSADDGVNGELLWQSDGTAAGTAPILGATGGSSLTVLNGEIFYVSFQSGHGNQLWVSDGTAAGTAPLTDFNTGSFFGFDPSNFATFNGELYFRASDGSDGYQLWKTDGTAIGTVMLTSTSSIGGLYPEELTVANGTLYFQVHNNNNVQLWKTDGTVAGTGPVATVYFSNSGPLGETINVNGTLFFQIRESGDTRLWTSDGTTSGTVSIATLRDIENLVSFNGKLYFDGWDGVHGYQLWTSDGTAAGTVMVTNINSAHGSLTTGPLTVADGRLLFAGDNGVNGAELWASDGTAAGTSMVADINPGSAGSNPAGFTVVDGVVYFTADDGTHGLELWKVGAIMTGFEVIAPSTSVAGVPITVTVQAQNDFGGIDANYSGTLNFASSDGHAVLPSNSTLAGGIGTFTVILKTAGNQQVIATDTANNSLAGVATIDVSPAAAAYFVVTGYPSTTVKGDAHDFTVTAYDAYGNVATGYRGTVTFTSSDDKAGLPVDYTFTADDAGVHTFSASFERYGYQSIIVTDILEASISGSEFGILVVSRGKGR